MLIKKAVHAAQNETGYTGELTFGITNATGQFPVEDAVITIYAEGELDNPIEQIRTDESGRTENINLVAPPFDYSMEPEQARPYAEYTVEITAPGYDPAVVEGVEVLPDRLAIQNVRLNPTETAVLVPENIVIPEHTLYGEYPPKIPEDEIKTVQESGEIVLSRVVIPEYVIVHDGVPNDTSAPNYYVRYKDYIKNVASSEIYATWPEAAIYANILCIMSVTLNRVYTEWYRNRGYNFTITSSTAYDQKWIYGRNIYENIDYLVDSVFNNFLSRPGVRQPIFAGYCDGQRVTCDGLKQWGSKYLADEGYSAIEILRNYYGNDIYINSTDMISGVPSSWPGYNLTIGSSGTKVRQLQQQLNRIARNYPALPTVTVDGVYGNNTANAVRSFQRVFNLPQTGVVDYPTWYEVSDIYVGVTRIAEPA